MTYTVLDRIRSIARVKHAVGGYLSNRRGLVLTQPLHKLFRIVVCFHDWSFLGIAFSLSERQQLHNTNAAEKQYGYSPSGQAKCKTHRAARKGEDKTGDKLLALYLTNFFHASVRYGAAQSSLKLSIRRDSNE
jgi:hypothetical protein